MEFWIFFSRIIIVLFGKILKNRIEYCAIVRCIVNGGGGLLFLPPTFLACLLDSSFLPNYLPTLLPTNLPSFLPTFLPIIFHFLASFLLTSLLSSLLACLIPIPFWSYFYPSLYFILKIHKRSTDVLKNWAIRVWLGR